MSTAIVDLGATGPLAAAGWTMLLAAWTTGVAALLCAAWLLVRSHSSTGRHRAILVAYVCSGALAISSPLLLLAMKAAGASSAPLSPAASAAPAAHLLPAVPGSLAQPETEVSRRVAIAAALGWIVGAMLLLARVGLGWMVARQIRRRALPLDDPELLDAVDSLAAGSGISRPDLLVSERVEAPVVLGASRPAIILPGDMTRVLTCGDIAPLIAHEIAHVRRRDYAVNLVQSIADALLFFSPGVLWLSARLREAREFCCDDHAVRWCGDPARYARALTAMAALGTALPSRPVLGASGPRLLERVRRLLADHPRPRWRAAGALGLLPVLLAAGYLSPAVARLSAQGVAAASTSVTVREPDRKWPAGGFEMTMSWAAEQPGAYVTMVGGRVGAPTGVCSSFKATNNANVSVTELTFVAIVSSRRQAKAVRVVPGQPIPVSIAPNATVDVAVDLLPTHEAADMTRELGSELQILCGLTRIVYENGTIWETRPNPAAYSGSEALNYPPRDLPRERISATASPSSPVRSVCQDETGASYSDGALIQVRNEPGTFAECRNGRWIEHGPLVEPRR